MTDTDAPATDESDTAAREAPAYKSPFDQFLENLPFGLGSLFDSGGAEGGGGSGQFELSLEEMRELHRQFLDEVQALEDMRQDSSQAGQMLRPLAPDKASREHYEAAQLHFEKLQEAIDQQRAFAEKFGQAVKSAIDVYAQNESSAIAKFRSQGAHLT